MKKTKHIVLNILLIAGGTVIAFMGIAGVYFNIADSAKDGREIGGLPYGLELICIGVVMVGSGVVNLKDGE